MRAAARGGIRSNALSGAMRTLPSARLKLGIAGGLISHLPAVSGVTLDPSCVESRAEGWLALAHQQHITVLAAEV